MESDVELNPYEVYLSFARGIRASGIEPDFYDVHWNYLDQIKKYAPPGSIGPPVDQKRCSCSINGFDIRQTDVEYGVIELRIFSGENKNQDGMRVGLAKDQEMFE